MTALEKDIEQKLVAMVKRYGGECLKWVCPGWSGVPDRIILLPGGHIMFVETKRPKGGKVSKMQEYWRDTLHRMGFDYWLVINTDHLATLELVIQDELGRG